MHQLPFFAAAGYFVITMSVRGWGASALDDDNPTFFSSQYLAADVIAVLDDVGAATAAIVGHSIGGFYVARILVEAPHRVTHAVMSSTFYGLVDETRDANEKPLLLRFVTESRLGSPARDALAAEMKRRLPESLASRPSCVGGRTMPPPNFSALFQRSRPELCWLYAALVCLQ